MDKEILKGSIDILLLSIIKQHDTYGYEIIQKLKENSIHNEPRYTLPSTQTAGTKGFNQFLLG
ncbi:transcriptional regulator, PadR family [Bacillus cereus]|nr:transcriptional regulator, PadR family [Bacillus cereus]